MKIKEEEQRKARFALKGKLKQREESGERSSLIRTLRNAARRGEQLRRQGKDWKY